MAITIYKYAYHVGWDTEGVAVTRKGGSSSNVTVDLSNYYTKTDLQTSGQSEINFDNISDAYHNNLLDIQGGVDTSSGDSSGGDAEYYHLDLSTYLDILNISFVHSVDKDSVNAVSLVNDETSPGTSMLYGTNEAGTKGWYAQPTGNIDVSGIPVNDQLAIWVDADTLEGSANLTFDGSTLTVTGSVTVSSGITAANFCLSSDVQLKKNIKTYTPKDINIEYKEFEMRQRPGEKRYGIIAQSLLKDYPEFVYTDSNGYLSVAYIDLLCCEIANLKNKIIELERMIHG